MVTGATRGVVLAASLGFFSVFPEDISQTTQTEVNSCTRVMPRWSVAVRRFLFC